MEVKRPSKVAGMRFPATLEESGKTGNGIRGPAAVVEALGGGVKP